MQEKNLAILSKILTLEQVFVDQNVTLILSYQLES
jgi:hypothetical protein